MGERSEVNSCSRAFAQEDTVDTFVMLDIIY